VFHRGVVRWDYPDRLVIAPWVPHLKQFRISFTLTALNETSRVIFLVSGSDKCGVLAAVLQGDELSHAYPAQAIHPVDGEVTWLVDRAAAKCLKDGGQK
jgi:6-phosphogluconolactonase